MCHIVALRRLICTVTMSLKASDVSLLSVYDQSGGCRDRP